MTMASKKGAMGSGFTAQGPPATMRGQPSSLSRLKKGMFESSSMVRMLL